MGDVGLSKPDIGFTGAHDYAIWLGEALDALGLTSPHVVSMSFGGYVALSYAMKPGRVSSTIGFDPVGVVDLKLVRFISWGVAVGVASMAPGPIRRRMAKRLRQPLINDKAAAGLLIQAQRGHPMKVPPLPVFTDEQLASITTPVRVLAGAESKMFDVEKMVERIATTVPAGEARLLPEAGHALPISHFDDCIAMIRDALDTPIEGTSL